MRTDHAAVPEVIDNLRRTFQAINEYSKSAAQTTGLTGPQLWAVKILAKDAPLRVSDLAKEMYLRPATVVGILNRLEKKGLISRTRSCTDRRAVDLQLTAAGKLLVANAPEVAQAMLLQGLNTLSNEQFDHVVNGMQLMVRMLNAEELVPRPLHSQR